jgi:CRISPR/Cas system-associated exonuclease Cas4 (RecB family)
MELNRLEATLASLPGISDEVFTRLMVKVVRGLRIPFEGEPLSGLQVMGILETRALDFRHVILLSMNEEVMPSRMVGQTNIPYAFRLAFGMPSREDMEAIYAYYFYRLLQRAEKVDLMYNSATEGTKTGEMSRYLHQLWYGGKEVQMIRPGLEVKSREDRSIVIGHTREVEEKLGRYLSGNDGGKFLSPSALNAYIDCPLRFYFRHIAGIGEPEEVAEEIDHREFGTVVHDCLAELYRELTSGHEGILKPEGLGALLESGKISIRLEGLFRKHHFKGRKSARIEGRNIIVLKVMERLVRKTIERDREVAPFALLSTERKFTRELGIPVPAPVGEQKIVLGGYIDRLDRVDGHVRVIDYKTGRAEMHFKSMEELFEGNSSNRNRAALQVLLYAWLVEKEFAGEKIMPGIYAMRDLFRDDFAPGLKVGGKRGEPLEDFASAMDDFLALLRETLARIFDPAVPFVQTDKEDHCRYCDYASICGRATFE